MSLFLQVLGVGAVFVVGGVAGFSLLIWAMRRDPDAFLRAITEYQAKKGL